MNGDPIPPTSKEQGLPQSELEAIKKRAHSVWLRTQVCRNLNLSQDEADIANLLRHIDWLVTLPPELRDSKRVMERGQELLKRLEAAKPARWMCQARPTADPPQDCDWPHCGCDPHVERVISGLRECGYEVKEPCSAPETVAEPAGKPMFSDGQHVRFIDPTLDHAEWVVSRTSREGWVYLYLSTDRCYTHFAQPEQLREIEQALPPNCGCRSPGQKYDQDCPVHGENAQETIRADFPADCSGEPASCPDNSGRGCYCSQEVSASHCKRSHPHENMNEECMRLTEVARRFALKASAQSAITDVRPLDVEQARRDVSDVIAEERQSEKWPHK